MNHSPPSHSCLRSFTLNTHAAIVGDDADLILMSLVSFTPHLYIINASFSEVSAGLTRVGRAELSSGLSSLH